MGVPLKVGYATVDRWADRFVPSLRCALGPDQ